VIVVVIVVLLAAAYFFSKAWKLISFIKSDIIGAVDQLSSSGKIVGGGACHSTP
jgi:hypothetical protein